MVSVCMATFNGAKYVKEQIVSILMQLAADDELIISDDGSTDETIDVIQSIGDSRIKLYHGNYKNVIRNFENALMKSSGDIVLLADQDDVWMDTKVDRIKTSLEQYDLVISDCYVVDEQLNIIYPSFFDFFKSGKGLLKNIVKSTYYGSCMAFRRDLLKRSLPFPDTKEIGHDLWIGLVAEMTGTVLFLKEPLIRYRRHNNAFTSAGVGESKRSLFSKFRGRLIMLNEVVKFYLKYTVCRKG
jgi:glycosyltransferase involved in cell wall biosynthesis